MNIQVYRNVANMPVSFLNRNTRQIKIEVSFINIKGLFPLRLRVALRGFAWRAIVSDS